jgi:hypothetical protein
VSGLDLVDPTGMGDDGTGHCYGCGNPLAVIDVDCAVCLRALDVIYGGADARPKGATKSSARVSGEGTR